MLLSTVVTDVMALWLTEVCLLLLVDDMPLFVEGVVLSVLLVWESRIVFVLDAFGDRVLVTAKL